MPSVLITGASSGIGRATALRLASAGWDVHAGVRSERDGAALAAAGPGASPRWSSTSPTPSTSPP